ncbi:MAG: PQQ-binding-like beta-propeller repeat protein [Pirellula sp.]
MVTEFPGIAHISSVIVRYLSIWSCCAVGLVVLGFVLNLILRNRSGAVRHDVWLSVAICLLITPLGIFWVPALLPSAPVHVHLLAVDITAGPEPLSLFADASNANLLSRSSDSGFIDAPEMPNGIDQSDEINNSIRAAGSSDLMNPWTMPQSDGYSKTQVAEWFFIGLALIWIIGGAVCTIQVAFLRRKLASAFEDPPSPADASMTSLVRRIASAAGFRVALPNQPRSLASLTRTIELTISKSESGPLLWGTLPIKLLLPASIENWPLANQEAAIRHEIAHAQRGDEWVRMFLLVLRTGFWFHPLVRYCCNQVQFYAEIACDDRVLQQGVSPAQYSQLLLSIDRQAVDRKSLWVMSGIAKSDVGRRIYSILAPHSMRHTISRPLAAMLFIVLYGVSSLAFGLRSQDSGKQTGLPTQATTTPKLDSPNDAEASTQLQVGKRDWPQWGGSASRNNTPDGKNIPVKISAATGENIKWSMPLGSESYGGVVVANGKVFAGTNNGAGYHSRFPKDTDLGVLMCFKESDGTFLWQHSNPKLPTGRDQDWPLLGVSSAPLVDGNRLWYVNNRCELVCLDTEGFHDGENDGPFTNEVHADKMDADVVWVLDMIRQLNVTPKNMSHCSVACAGDLLFVGTSQGDPPRGQQIVDGPSFLCVSRATGKVLWMDYSPSGNILNGQWSSPAFGVLGGVPQVIFGGGDGYLYGFLATGEEGNAKLLWKFDCNPKESVYKLNGATRLHVVATPVIYDGLVYVSVGESPEHGEGPGRLWCIDPTKRGDVSPTLVYNRRSPDVPIPHKRKQALIASEGDFEKPNPNSAAVWSYVGADSKNFEQTMHRTCGTVAIHENLLFVADFSGLLHCLNAKTGTAYWTYDLVAACWASPLIVEGKVYIGDEDGDLAIFRCAKTYELLSEVNLASPIYSTPVVANDTLFVACRNRLFAFQQGAKNTPNK